MDGIVIINKEKNWTSNDIVQKLKGMLHEKTGHTGTLDPLATGVLPILVGKGTSLSKYLINHNKEYIATIKLGKKTTTADSEGEIVEQKKVNNDMLEKENVIKVLESFKGKQSQIPPMYSAIKVNGKKLYQYARSGQNIKIEPREIEIYNIELISILEEEKEIIYKVQCSKGTYIRSLCEDIAEKLGTVGFMKELKITKVGDFCIEDSLKIGDVEENIGSLDKKIITIESFFESSGKINLSNKQLERFLNGVRISVLEETGIYRVYNEDIEFVGIGRVEDGRLKRDIIV